MKSPKEFIVIVTEQGKIIKFKSIDLKDQTRGGKGVRGIMLENGDVVASAFIVEDLVEL